MLGVLPPDPARRGQRLSLDADGRSAYADALRKLRTNVLYADVDSPPKTIAFISPTSTISTTATATNLAVVLDGMGRRVVLVDADMRQPRLARYLGEVVYPADRYAPAGRDAGPHASLGSVITGAAGIDDAIGRIPGTSLDVLSAGPPSKASGEILASDSLVKLLTELRNTYDFVFCDTPGMSTATDATVTGLACDAVVLVAVQGKTRRDDLSGGSETLRGLGAKVIGVVLTESR
ncbi:hypothetical protein A5662_03130 [Mycobacteriaceae bacterium 1482268.1]|nr:hypothetical protein A5662_03130 [Mycobacteriaceae bacterium 1482268.1]